MDEVLQGFMGRESGPIVQFIKYALCGGIATAVHILLFHLAAWRLFPALQRTDPFVVFLKLQVPHIDDSTRSRNSMLDNGIAFLFSNLTAYLLNVLWVFEPGRHSVAVEIGLFYLVSGISVVVGTSLMGLLIRRLGWQTTLAFCANLITALVFNFALRKFLIFKG